MLDTEKLLKLIAEDAKLTNAQLAAMLGAREEEVASAVASLEKEGIIKGYKALIDWDKTDRNLVSARIEIKVIPKGSMGFEEIAYTISQFREVETCYLMSGGYDLCVMAEARTMRQLAFFVAEKLSTLDSVISTATHFMLKKYKEDGVIFEGADAGDHRLAVSP